MAGSGVNGCHDDANGAKWAGRIADAFAYEFGSGAKGVGLLPERYAFSLSVDPNDEARFLRVLELLLRTQDASGQEPPVNVLAFRWVSPAHEEEGLDQSEWQLIFEPNAARTEATDTETTDYLQSLLDLVAEHCADADNEGTALWEQVSLIGTRWSSPDESLRALGEALSRDPRIAPFVHPDYPRDVQARFPPLDDAPPGYRGSLIWVQIAGVGAQPDTWIGEVLNNDPIVGMHKGDLVLLRCDGGGLTFASRVRPGE